MVGTFRRLQSEGPHAVAACAVRVTACLALLAAAACSALPRDVPSPDEVHGYARVSVKEQDRALAYAVVDLKPGTLRTANLSTTAFMPSYPGDLPRGSGGRQDVRISVGDILSITIFEAAAGGLFIPSEAGARAGNFVQVPNQQVDSSGNIDVPYAGSLRVAGQTARAVSTEIARRLATRAIEPQAVVTINERRGSDVSVLGEVNTPARFSMDPGGLRLTGAIARGGGPRYPAYETIVTIQRNGRSHRALLSSIIKNPNQNVQILTGDVVFLSREPRSAMFFGATPDPTSGNTRRITFENDEMSLAEGLAKADGLLTTRADPRSVFIFRLEPKRVLEQLGVDTAQFSTPLVPTVYALNLGTSEGLFVGNGFLLRDKDMVVASEASSVEYLKFINIFNQSLQVPYNVAIVAR